VAPASLANRPQARSRRQLELRFARSDPGDHALESGPGEGPLERPGDLGVADLEATQALAELLEGAEVVRGQPVRWTIEK
jgi:hypothetical protein